MKKFLLLALVALLVSPKVFAFGDDDHSYTAFAMNYNYQDVKSSAAGLLSNNFMMHGGALGFTVHQKLVSCLYLTTGVTYQFTMRREYLEYYDFDLINHDIKVPLKLAFSMAFGKNSVFSIHVGPSLDFMVSTQMNYYKDYKNYEYFDMVAGKDVTRENGELTKETQSDDAKILGWFDIPLGVGAAINFGRFGLRFDYEWGMINRCLNKEYTWKADQLTAGIYITF